MNAGSGGGFCLRQEKTAPKKRAEMLGGVTKDLGRCMPGSGHWLVKEKRQGLPKPLDEDNKRTGGIKIRTALRFEMPPNTRGAKVVWGKGDHGDRDAYWPETGTSGGNCKGETFPMKATKGEATRL